MSVRSITMIPKRENIICFGGNEIYNQGIITDVASLTEQLWLLRSVEMC